MILALLFMLTFFAVMVWDIRRICRDFVAADDRMQDYLRIPWPIFVAAIAAVAAAAQSAAQSAALALAGFNEGLLKLASYGVTGEQAGQRAREFVRALHRLTGLPITIGDPDKHPGEFVFPADRLPTSMIGSQNPREFVLTTDRIQALTQKYKTMAEFRALRDARHHIILPPP